MKPWWLHNPTYCWQFAINNRFKAPRLCFGISNNANAADANSDRQKNFTGIHFLNKGHGNWLNPSLPAVSAPFEQRCTFHIKKKKKNSIGTPPIKNTIEPNFLALQTKMQSLQFNWTHSVWNLGLCRRHGHHGRDWGKKWSQLFRSSHSAAYLTLSHGVLVSRSTGVQKHCLKYFSRNHGSAAQLFLHWSAQERLCGFSVQLFCVFLDHRWKEHSRTLQAWIERLKGNCSFPS